MTAWLVRWRLALRIARRDALRAKGRTVLVLLMVGLPVLAIVGGYTLFRTSQVSAAEQLPATLGSADARIEGVTRDRVWADPSTGEIIQTSGDAADPPWSAAEVLDRLPADTGLAEVRTGQLVYRTDAGYATVDGYADDLTDPLRQGAVEVLDGRVPAADGEVAISRSVVRRGIAVGDELALTRDDVPATVVGVLDSDARPGPFLVVAPEVDDLLSRSSAEFYAAVPGGLSWSAVQELNEQGLVVVSREVVADPPAEAEFLPPGYPPESGLDPAEFAVLALIVVALLLEVVLLAGPAFAVGLRRQRRDLALLVATGGAPGDLRRVVLASGVVLGGAAAVLGALLGIGLAAIAVPVIESRSDIVFGPLDVPVLDVLVVVAVGTLAGLAAAAVPARQAARTDVVTTLSGRRGQVRTSWRLPALGLVAAAGGLALTVLGAQGTEFGVAGGAVLLIVGMVAATPWLIGLLAPLARRLPTAGRLAVRDATRNRSRTAPAVAAVMATVAGVIALAIGSASDSAQARRDYVAQAPMGTAVITGALDAGGWANIEAGLATQDPDRPVHAIQGVPWSNGGTLGPHDLVPLTAGCTGPLVDCLWSPTEVAAVTRGSDGGVVVLNDPQATVVTARFGEVAVADAAALRALDRGDLPPAALEALEGGSAVVFGTGAVSDAGQVALAVAEYDERGRVTVVASTAMPAIRVPIPPGVQVEVPALVVVPPVLADRLPVEVTTAALITGGPDDPVTPAQEAELTERVAAVSSWQSVYVERGFDDHLALARWLLIGIGGALVLVATLTATGLALADARPDFATLAAVGAAPGTRRRMAMGSAAMIGGTGALLGVLVGLAPGIAVAYPLTSTDYGMDARPLVDVPWLVLAAVAVAVPLLAVAVTGFFVRSRLPMASRIS